jgi:hypothetical protein
MDRERGGKWMIGRARRKPPEEGNERRGLWGKKSRDAGGVETGGCADNGSGSSTDSGGSERENVAPATIRNGTQRAPQAP